MLPVVGIDAAFPKWKTKTLKAHTLNMVKLCNTNFGDKEAFYIFFSLSVWNKFRVICLKYC